MVCVYIYIYIYIHPSGWMAVIQRRPNSRISSYSISQESLAQALSNHINFMLFSSCFLKSGIKQSQVAVMLDFLSLLLQASLN